MFTTSQKEAKSWGGRAISDSYSAPQYLGSSSQPNLPSKFQIKFSLLNIYDSLLMNPDAARRDFWDLQRLVSFCQLPVPSSWHFSSNPVSPLVFLWLLICDHQAMLWFWLWSAIWLPDPLCGIGFSLSCPAMMSSLTPFKLSLIRFLPTLQHKSLKHADYSLPQSHPISRPTIHSEVMGLMSRL